MKKTGKYSLIILAVILVPAILFFGRFFIKMKIETGKMKPLESSEVIPGVYSIKEDFVNMHLVKSGNKFIAIDAAMDSKNIEKELKKLKINPDQVIAVLLTHSDGDHVGSIKLFKNAEVYIAKAEEEMINGSTARFYFFHNKLDSEYKTLNNGQEIKIDGFNIKCIFTPGHTPGSAVYLINDKYLFIGDTLRLKDGKVHTFNDFFNMDTERQKQFIDELKKFKNIKYIFTGHYGFSNNPAEAFE